MKLSIIIVNWNGLEHLRPCLDALTAQSLQADEIIIVDNASKDNSVPFLKANYPNIKLLELKQNGGFGGGNIAGFEIATGDYIVLLNNDTKPLPDWLEQLVSCAEEHPDAGIVASLMTDWDGQFIDTAGDGCTVTGRGFKWAMQHSTTKIPQSGYVFSACAGAALYKRAMIKDVGFFDEAFFMNAEDTDLAFRAQLKGWQVFFCAEAVVRHRVSASQGTHSTNAVYYSSRNHLWLYLKCMPRNLMLKYFPSYLSHLLMYLAFFTLKGKLYPYLRGMVDALRDLPHVLAKRKEIQAKRCLPNRKLESRLSLLSELIQIRLSK